jgi:hypothetical protein
VCAQPCINIDVLEPQMEALLSSIRIPKAFHEWAIEQIKEDQQKYISDRNLTFEKSRNTYDNWVDKIDKLVEKYVEGKVPEDVYQRKLIEFEAGKNLAQKVLNNVDERIEERISELDEDLDFAVKARLEFENGGLAKRRDIITRLGSNFILYDSLLDVIVREPLERVQEISSLVNEVAEQFEPLNNADKSAQFKLYMSTSMEMGG